MYAKKKSLTQRTAGPWKAHGS